MRTEGGSGSGRRTLSSGRPGDTTPEAWAAQSAALDRLGPEGRVRAAIDLSESVRSIQLEGMLARNPGWNASDAVRHLLLDLGAELSESA